MKKITIEVEFEKYGTFGRTTCQADMDVYEDSGFLTKETIDRVVKYVNKLFSNMNLFNPCVTFIYRDIDTEPVRNRHYVARVFGVASNLDLNKVIWSEGDSVPREESIIKKMTRKEIINVYKVCVARAMGEE